MQVTKKNLREIGIVGGIITAVIIGLVIFYFVEFEPGLVSSSEISKSPVIQQPTPVQTEQPKNVNKAVAIDHLYSYRLGGRIKQSLVLLDEKGDTTAEAGIIHFQIRKYTDEDLRASGLMFDTQHGTLVYSESFVIKATDFKEVESANGPGTFLEYEWYVNANDLSDQSVMQGIFPGAVAFLTFTTADGRTFSIHTGILP